MKKQHKAAISFALALIFALVSLPASALPRFDVKAEVTPAWTVPEGYNVNDYTKCVEFLEQTDENGVKNGEKISASYDPNDPETWRSAYDMDCCFEWIEYNNVKSICRIKIGGFDLCGSLDLSGCASLRYLSCGGNNLTELDVTGCSILSGLWCSENNITELDVTQNIWLSELECLSNNLTELDLSNNSLLAYDRILADGNGLVGYVFADYYSDNYSDYDGYILACPTNDASFEGFYDESGELISEGEYTSDYPYHAYRYSFEGKHTGTVIARFSGGEQPMPYNAHDLEKCRNFLEQTDGNGVKNGKRLNPRYNPNNLNTWCDYMGESCFYWEEVNDELMLNIAYLNGYGFSGKLDLSGCIGLYALECGENNLTELDVTGCAALEALSCGENELTKLDITDCPSLMWLHCHNNQLTELDLTGCPALIALECSGNSLTELDVTVCPALECMACSGNSLTELDLSNNPWLDYDHIRAEGNGFVGYGAFLYFEDSSDSGEEYRYRIYAFPTNGAEFEGFYDENGALVSEGESHGDYYIYTFRDESNGFNYYYDEPLNGTIIARFSGGELPYNAHDLEKCRNFLEQMDDHGYTNGEHISSNYDPNDPDTWVAEISGEPCFYWIAVNDELRLKAVNLNNRFVWGMLNLSDCTELTSLLVSNNRLTDLSVGGCTKLETVNCENNNIMTLWLNSFSALKELDCSDNDIDTMNLFGYSALEKLDCSNNYIARLYVYDSPMLKTLECNSNNLIMLDVTNCTALEELNCAGNHLTFIEGISDCTALKTLNCSDNEFTELDVSKRSLEKLDVSSCIALEVLNCSYNKLTELDVTGCTALEYLNCSYNKLTELDVTQNTALKELRCSYNSNYVSGRGIAELELTQNAALEYLDCSVNSLAELDLTGCTALVSLDCCANYLTELDLSSNTALEYLYCNDNDLTKLDVTQCTALVKLICYENNLTELDITQNTSLEELSCGFNSLTELDVTRNTALRYLECCFNYITELDISNNHRLAFNHILAEGRGFVGCSLRNDSYWSYGFIIADPVNGASFEGFYDERGCFISEGEWRDEFDAYCYEFEGNPTGTVIARFSGGVTPGDTDGDGTVSMNDALTTMRISLGAMDGSGLNTDAADMDGNGSITLADAIIILRAAMGLA